MTLPALTVLRKALPETRISLLVKPWVAPIFENNPNVDEIIPYEDKHKGIIGTLRLARMLNKIIQHQPIFRSNCFIFIRKRNGKTADPYKYLRNTIFQKPHVVQKIA